MTPKMPLSVLGEVVGRGDEVDTSLGLPSFWPSGWPCTDQWAEQGSHRWVEMAGQGQSQSVCE